MEPTNHTNQAFDERASAAFEPDTMLASQYFDRIRRRPELDPERRLMFAVLEDAVKVCLKNVGTEDPGRRELLSEAEDWIADRDSTWLYSFENICSVLDLEPDYIRRGLRATKERANERAHLGRPKGDAPEASVPEPADEPLRLASGE